MATIAIKELKRVLSLSKNIKEHNTIPILSYIKLHCTPALSTFTKTNLHAFVVAELECVTKKAEVFIIEEKTLIAAVTNSKGDEITFSHKGDNIIIDDGVRSIKSQTEADENFPTVKLPDTNEGVELTGDIISAIAKAKTHVNKRDDMMLDWRQYVHCTKLNGKSTIVGTNGKIGYFKFFDEDLPQFTIDTDIISILSEYPLLHFCESDNYNYFFSIGVTWGFVKTEVKCADIGGHIAKLKSDDSFVVAKKDIVSFCDLSIGLTRSMIDPLIEVSDNGNGGIILSFSDISDSNSVKEDITVEQKTFKPEQFGFNPGLMTTLLKPVTGEKVKLTRVQKCTVLTSDDYQNYLGFIMDVAQ